MLELDRNDRFGSDLPRDAENSVFMVLAGVLQTHVRREDIACRFGPEKFALILPQGSQEIILRRAERLQGLIHDLQVRHRNQVLEGFTVSMGAALCPEHGRTGESLIRAADAALQRAKNEGGGRIVNAV